MRRIEQKQPQQPIQKPTGANRQLSTIQNIQKVEDVMVTLRSDIGMSRITIKSNSSVMDLIELISKTIGLKSDQMIVYVEGKEILQKMYNQNVMSIQGFEMGAMITLKVNPNARAKVNDTKMEQEQPPSKQNVIYNVKGEIVSEEKLRKLEHSLTSQQKQKEHALSQFCNHGPLAKCVNCLEQDPQKKDEKPIDKAHCNHGPFGKCLNCTPPTKEDLKNPNHFKLLCQHGPNGKCTHCLDSSQISNIKHMSFDQYLAEAKLKCKGCHPADAKCNNCLPPTSISYKVKQDCKNHVPWPQAMCNACLPPSVVLKRQPYRHVDYVEFLNTTEIANFVTYWTSKGKSEQRLGYVYGYYAEDINYKGGVRAVVEAIYEPPQKGSFGSVELLIDPFENEVNHIAGNLNLERIGWIFTSINHDCFLTSEELRKAARYQQEFNAIHDSGYKVSKFLTIVLRPKKDNPEEIVPEVYMVSDQMQQLEYDGLFTDSGRRKVLNVRNPKDDKDIIPNFVQEGKSVKEFEPDFFIVNVAHGYSPNSNYNILKLYDFPVENRATQIKPQDVKNHLIKHSKKPSQVKYSNFHLLIFLAKLIDMDSVSLISQAVGEEQEVSNEIQEIIKLYVNQ